MSTLCQISGINHDETLFRHGFFGFLRQWGGGGGLRDHPLELQSTTHPMANKITHNNVLIISNYWANLIDIMT